MKLGNMQVSLPQAIVLAAGLLALAAVLTWAPEDTRVVVIEWLGWGVAAASALLGPLLRAQTPAEEGAQRRARRRATALDDTRRGGPPSTGAAALALAVLAACCTVSASGCGASALALQADAAAITGRVVAQADAVIIRARAADLEARLAAAQAECGSTGCDDGRGAELVDAYDARVREWAPGLACRAPVVEGLRAWVDAIELAHRASSEDLGLSHAIAEAARVVLLWRGARTCIDAVALQLGATLDLPDLPAWIYPYAESAAP